VPSNTAERALYTKRPPIHCCSQNQAKDASSLTASLRFDGALNVDITEFQTASATP
jgi:tubulin alpha